jgi:DNA-binding MarR family transcriptional regulator
MSRSAIFDEHVNAVRAFNRFYTSRMGFLNRGWDNSLSLTDARIIHEIYTHPSLTATDIARIIHMDAGFLSRSLRKMEAKGYITRRKKQKDGRQRRIAMTAKGTRIYEAWSEVACQNFAGIIGHLDGTQKNALRDAMQSITDLLGQGESGKV